MKYSETELTETTKIIAYIRSLQRYAVAISIVGVAYLVFRLYATSEIIEISLLCLFAAVMVFGSLSFIIRPNHNTSIIYGFSCIVSALMFLFSLYFYRNTTTASLTTVGIIIAILVIRQGVMLLFGKQSQYIFSRKIQQRISFVKNIIKSLKKSDPNDANVVHSTYTNDGKTRNMKIQFLEDNACFILNGHTLPMFFDHSNISIFELQDNGDSLHVSVSADNHDWLEADLKPDDFKKYEVWKDNIKK